MNNNESFVDLIYEIAPESRYWSGIVSDLEKYALEDFEIEANKTTNNDKDETSHELNREQHEILCTILPHLQRVLNIQKKLVHLEQQRDLAAGLLESMPVGILVVKQNGKIISLNRVANRLFETSGIISNREGSFLIYETSFPEFLSGHRNTQGIIREDSIHQILKNENEELSVLIAVSRLENHYIVFLSDEQGKEYVSRDSLQKLFPITATEADLCVHLINGHGVEEIAQIRHTSLQTIRTQFKNIFRKTRTTGQVQLMRKILTSLARINPEEYGALIKPQNQNIYHRDENKTITCADGRRIGYAEYGNPDGYPIIFCHSIFGSRFEHPPQETLEQNSKNRIIVPERPGYGMSDYINGCNYVNWLDDLEMLLSNLDIKTFAIAGLSSGAIYASAAASKMQNRVSHLTLLSMTPKINSWQDLKHVSVNLKFFGAFSLYLPQAARLLFEKEAQRFRGKPEKMIERITDNEADRKLLISDAVFPIVSRNYQQSVKKELQHLSNEILIHTKPWGFSFSDIKCPVDVWSGELDFYAPKILVKKTTDQLLNKTYHLIPGKGHFFFYELWSEMLSVAMRRKQDMSEYHSIV